MSFRIYLAQYIAMERSFPEAPVFHVKGFISTVSGDRTPYFLELHDKGGRILEAQRLHIDNFHKSLDDAYLDFFIAVPWHEEADQLVFKRKEHILHSIKIGEAVPEVQITAPKGDGTLTGKQKVTWAAECGEKPLSYILRYSSGGEKCLFQVLASEGIRTGAATSAPFLVPRKPRKSLSRHAMGPPSFKENRCLYSVLAIHLPVVQSSLRY